MFEEELAMEKKESSMVPLLLIVALIISIVGVAVYYLMENRKVLTSEEASSLISASLKAQGPVTIHFQTGNVAASVEERPYDPNYRLLEKAGLIKIGKDTGRFTPVTLTPKGEQFLATIPGVSKAKAEKENAITYVVPVAERKLVGSPKITTVAIGRATAEFSWAWEPNAMGELLDAAGPLVRSFNTWDRSRLISKYGVQFYHGEPTRVVMSFAKGDKTWQIAAE
jgi:hypothetical protein